MPQQEALIGAAASKGSISLGYVIRSARMRMQTSFLITIDPVPCLCSEIATDKDPDSHHKNIIFTRRRLCLGR